jgi:hypothetical protein
MQGRYRTRCLRQGVTQAVSGRGHMPSCRILKSQEMRGFIKLSSRIATYTWDIEPTLAGRIAESGSDHADTVSHASRLYS